MDRRLAEAIIAEKQKREAWAEEVRAIVLIDHELTSYPYDRVRVGQLQHVVCEALGLEARNPSVQARVNLVLLGLGLGRKKLHGRDHYCGVRRRPSSGA